MGLSVHFGWKRGIVLASFYEMHGEKTALFKICPEKEIDNCVTTEEMSRLYKGHFSRMKSPSRHMYDAIMTSSWKGFCPLCSHRQVTTLDHYLPKSLYPIFAVTPLNLIPSCSDCNKAKLN
jgi:hypothetical protein